MTAVEIEAALARLLARYRAVNPKSRTTDVVKLAHNSSSYKQYGCVLCNATGPRFSAKYAETKQSREWVRAHREMHALNVEAEMVAWDARDEGRSDGRS